MKTIKTLIFFVILCSGSSQVFSQSVNWASLKSEQKHIANINAGWDYGLVYGLGYSHQLKSKLPILLNLSYSFPSGEKLFDDFKTKIGGQFRLYSISNFQFSVSLHGIYRRYENPLVRLQNFGSEMTGVIGYYKPKWFVAGEVGFDKAIVTHFKHSELFKETIYANVKDGWYEPATGGNFNYGIQAGYSFKRSDIVLKIGKVLTQDFKTTPLIPYYLQLGYNYKINGRKSKEL
jgi:hypothetical protein